MRCLVLCSAGLTPALGAGVAMAAPPWMTRVTPASAHPQRPLLAVSCRSVRNCTAVGGLFAEHWNGERWSFEKASVPTSSNPPLDYLAGVSCAARRACLAVGSERAPLGANVPYDYSALAEAWTGSAWSDQSPSPVQTANGYLQAVSCPAATRCIAVGQGASSVLAMGWNGSGWTIQPAATPPGMSILTGVSCTSARRCMAVGYLSLNSASQFRPLAERWNGIAWSIVPTARTSGLQSTVLNAVTCRRHFCIAVGSAGFHQLVERWNGRRWSIQPAPAGAPAAALNGVSCVSAGACMAVGALTHRAYRSIAERWNGSHWTVEPTPAPGGGSLLWAVACPAAADCVAAGQRGSGPLLERWDGTRWFIQRTG